MKHPDMGRIRGGQSLEAGGCGRDTCLPTGFLGLGLGQALPLGSGWQPGPDLLAWAVGFYLDGVRWAALGTLGSSGHTGPSGRSSIRFHGASPLGAASSITNQCVFCWEAGHWLRRGDNGLPPLKWVSLHPSPPLSSLGEDSAQVPFSGASLQPLTLQNKRERERLDRRSEREKRALYNRDGGLPPGWKGRGTAGAGRGV